MTACIHAESLHGRCVTCGKTWKEQAQERRCSSLRHFPQDGPQKLQTCYLPRRARRAARKLPRQQELVIPMTHTTTVTYATDRNTGQPYRAAVSCSDCPRVTTFYGTSAGRTDLIRAAGQHVITVGSE